MLFEYACNVYENWQEGKRGWAAFQVNFQEKWRRYLGAGVGGLIAAIPGNYAVTAAVGAIGNAVDAWISGDMKDYSTLEKHIYILQCMFIGAGSNMMAKGIAEIIAKSDFSYLQSCNRSTRKAVAQVLYGGSNGARNDMLRRFSAETVESFMKYFLFYDIASVGISTWLVMHISNLISRLEDVFE